MALWNSFLIAFSVLLPLINPLGTALVFLALVGDAPPDVLRTLARKIAINNIIFLAIVQLTGAAILKFFGISLPIVQFSGGVVIAAMAWGLLSEKSYLANSKNKEKEAEPRNEADTSLLEAGAFYPLTFPITSGPGTLVSVLTLSANISNRELTQNILAHAGLLLSVVAISVIVYFCYAHAQKITKAISPSTAHGILRVIAFVLFCIGIQIAWNGLSALLAEIIH